MSKTEPFERYTEQYENWFEIHEAVYQSELEAVKMLIPEFRKGVEIGTGTGRFSAPLGIKHGLEPSPKMREIAVKRGIKVIEGVAEDLPFENCSFDLALMVTTICFLDDLDRSFKEVNRILEPGGVFITGFVDRESMLGKIYETHKKENVFYRDATFFSTKEIKEALERNGFSDLAFSQTVYHKLTEITEPEPAKPGFGEGSFVVIRARK